jgi:hypothetical protein
MQDGDGRWRWHELTHEAGLARGLHSGFVSFASQEEAQVELDAHLNAKRDETGRLIRTKADLDKMLSAGCQMTKACEGVTFAPVYWHERDAEGSNWGVATANGPDVHGCTDALAQVIERMRLVFSVPDEG